MSNFPALKHVAIAERDMRLLIRTTVEAFRVYAIALAADRLVSRGVEFEGLTSLEQEHEYQRTALPVGLFYAWLKQDMVNIFVTEDTATLQ